MPLSQTQLDILSIIKKSNHVLVLPSSPLDGDSLGSALSLYLALKKMGKKVTVVAEEAIPASYGFLPEIASISHEMNCVRDFIVTIDCNENTPENVRHEIQGNKVNIIVSPHKGSITKDHVTFSEGPLPFDCIITVDAGDPGQFGKIYETFTELFHLAPVINIDHHASNTGFGKINLVDIMAPATTVLILPLIEELGIGLVDADIATLLLAGLITDTGSFQNANTTPDAFALAAKLIGYGARQQEIIRNVYKTKKLSTLKLWGRTLSKIQYDEKHKIVWSVLTARDFAELGSSPDETEGVIDELMSNAPGAEIIFLLKEKNPTESSCSIRTLTPTVDASLLAEQFGGGGHTQAAGFKVKGKSITDLENEVVTAMRTFQKKRLNINDEGASTAPTQPPANLLKAQGVNIPLPAPAPIQAIAAPVATPTPVAAPMTPAMPAVPATVPSAVQVAPATPVTPPQAPVAAPAGTPIPPRPASVPAAPPPLAPPVSMPTAAVSPAPMPPPWPTTAAPAAVPAISPASSIPLAPVPPAPPGPVMGTPTNPA